MIRRLKKQLKTTSGFYNFAATAPLLKGACQEMRKWEKDNLYPLSHHFGKWLSCLESTRAKIAQLIKADPDEIAWMPNTSTALSTAAAAIPWKKGDRIVFLSDEFPSNRYVWQNIEEAECIAIAPDKKKTFLSQLQEIDVTKVRLVAISAISYLDGRLFPIQEIVAFCHSKGILVCVDAIQAVGAIPIDVKKWGCDFLASGGQKWLLGPVGSGFLYIEKSLIPKLKVPQMGWASVKSPGDFTADIRFTESARRFEPSLPPIGPVAGLGKSLEILGNIGWDKIFETIHKKRETLQDLCKSILFKSGAEPLGGGIVTVIKPLNLPQHYEVAERLETIRFSLHASSTLPKIHPVSNQNEDRLPITHALITGASQGLGFALAVALAKRGCHLTLLGRSEKTLKQHATFLEKNYGIKCQVYGADLSRLDSLPDHSFDLIINNAAEAHCESLMNESEEHLRQAFEVNFFSPWKIIKKYVPSMKKGIVINVVTTSSRFGLPYFSTYNASKAALWSLSEALGKEYSQLRFITFIPPHMATQTALTLGRKAFGFFRYRKSKSYKPEQVAEKLIQSLRTQKSLICPFFTRLKLALNQLFPDWMWHPSKTLYEN